MSNPMKTAIYNKFPLNDNIHSMHMSILRCILIKNLQLIMGQGYAELGMYAAPVFALNTE